MLLDLQLAHLRYLIEDLTGLVATTLRSSSSRRQNSEQAAAGISLGNAVF